MNRVITYIDGFNLYHALDDLQRPYLKWVDLWGLSASLLRRGEALQAVKYFTAYATWRPDAYARHRHYVLALKARGVEVHLARFKRKPERCRRCGSSWTRHEEKETDVHISVQLVADAFREAFDRAVLITADSDLKPAISMAREAHPASEVLVVAPPGRFASARDLRPRLELTAGRVGRNLLPAEVRHDGGTIRRPVEYDPPHVKRE
jgi:uncharacterized LabA/DUF88 family protein